MGLIIIAVMSKKYTNELIQEIVNARKGGLSYDDIKARYGCGACRVKGWAKELNINLTSREHVVVSVQGEQELPSNSIESKFFCQALTLRENSDPRCEGKTIMQIAREIKKGAIVI